MPHGGRCPQAGTQPTLAATLILATIGVIETSVHRFRGKVIAALISTLVGWLADRHGIKWFYLLGMGLLAGVALVYARLAQELEDGLSEVFRLR
jgi:MFS family permease